MSYEAVIGLEIHTELKTNSKMFSGSANVYGQKPNTAVNEIDLAHPGVLPSVNAKAVEYGVKIARALNCDIETLLRFDRKAYYYSDLPKGYQITQEFFPLGKKGYLDFYVDQDMQRVRINRLHLEEDTAKQNHLDDKTLIDFNRAGTPLVEIVTEADFTNGAAAASYVEAMRLLLIYLGVSDGKMAEGSLRCDVNISLKEIGSSTFGTKVEIKNLNSISNVEKSIDYEIKRQQDILERGESVVSETRRYDERAQKTVLMRAKDGVIDYRYIVDANIPPIQIPNTYLTNPLEETPVERLTRYQKDFDLSFYDASVLLQNMELSDYFDKVMTQSNQTRLVVNWLTQELLSVIDKKENKPLESWIPLQHFVDFIDAIASKEISSRQAKEVFTQMQSGKSPQSIIKEQGMVVVNDESTLETWIKEVIENNPRAVEDHRKGLPSAVKFVTGQVMRVSKGQANPQLAAKMIKEILDQAL